MMDLAQLKTELTGDPATLGYATLRTAGNHSGLADALNLVRAGAPFLLNVPEAESKFIRSAMHPADYLAMVAADKTYFGFLLAGDVVVLSTTVKDWGAAAIPNTNQSRARVAALFTRQGSRAEVLFGVETVVSSDDVGRALALP